MSLLTVGVGALGGLAVAVRSSTAVAGVLVVSAASATVSWIVHDEGWTVYPELAVPVALGLLLMPIARASSVPVAVATMTAAVGSVLLAGEWRASSEP